MSELVSTIWSISDKLRGVLSSEDFKNYVLCMLCYRYIFCERFEELLFAPRLIEALQNGVEEIYSKYPELLGTFEGFDLANPKLGNTEEQREQRIRTLYEAIASVDFSSDHESDILGDAYEHLISMYALNAGKSGGEFFTPLEVSRLLVKLGTLGKTRIEKVYDPSCGSGSLLLSAVKVLGRENVAYLYGQDINRLTYNLCRLNLFMHGVKFNIACEDTLLHPQHWNEQPFDLIVSNPPYSVMWSDDKKLLNDPRFSPAGVLAPKSKGDFAFVMHTLSWLASNGTAAIVCFPGIMYRGGAEQKIRQYLIENNFVDAVIQLPSNLFYSTSIATSILVLKKHKATNDILFVNAENEFSAGPNKKNILIDTKILETYSKRENVKNFSQLVKLDELDNFNLSPTTYVEAIDTREEIDIVALEAELERIHARNEESWRLLKIFMAEIKELRY